MSDLTSSERDQIATILKRRANEIASFKMDLSKGKDLASVDYALEREIERLRRLAERVDPPAPEEEDDTE
jgi:hypothetical protein